MDLDISEPEWVSRLKKKHQNVSDVLSLTDTPFERRDYRSPCAHGTKVLGIFHSSICRRALDDILQWAQIVGMGIESRRNTLWLGTGIHIYIHILWYTIQSQLSYQRFVEVVLVVPTTPLQQFSATHGLVIVWVWNSLKEPKQLQDCPEHPKTWAERLKIKKNNASERTAPFENQTVKDVGD